MILVRAQEEVKSRVEKVTSLENTDHHKQHLGRNMNAKDASSDVSEENEICGTRKNTYQR